MTNDALPPSARTMAGARLSAAAREDGTLVLQRCSACGTVQYPAREVCVACLGDDLPLQLVEGSATLLSWTVGHASVSPWFAARLPWRIGRLQLAAGPSVIAHLHPALATMGAPAQVTLLRDASGQAVLVAVPPGRSVAGCDLEQALSC